MYIHYIPYSVHTLWALQCTYIMCFTVYIHYVLYSVHTLCAFYFKTWFSAMSFNIFYLMNVMAGCPGSSLWCWCANHWAMLHALHTFINVPQSALQIFQMKRTYVELYRRCQIWSRSYLFCLTNQPPQHLRANLSKQNVDVTLTSHHCFQTLTWR